jgi:adenosylcobinamide kinase/adenosylcobinamide-phosphate guanylyltransferase
MERGRGQNFLIFGGSRSGKSRLAQDLAEFFIEDGGKGRGENRDDAAHQKGLFIATARALDGEMRRRIEQHRRDRKIDLWHTVEEPLDPAGVISGHGKHHSVILLDCITLWLSNLLLEGDRKGQGLEGRDGVSSILGPLEMAITACHSPVIMVSNEVGMGIVPGDGLARRFRDLAGFVNQALAAFCDSVIFCAAGLPMVLKGGLPPGFIRNGPGI